MVAELGSALTARLRSRPGPFWRSRLSWPAWHRRELAAFLVSALLVLAVVSAGTMWLSEKIAHDNALAGAESAAERLAEHLVAPDLRAALAGVPGRLASLDRAVTNRMSDGSVTRVVVWSADGRALYANTG